MTPNTADNRDRKDVERLLPEKEKVTQFQMEYETIPICSACHAPQGELNDKLIRNKVIADTTTRIMAARATEEEIARELYGNEPKKDGTVWETELNAIKKAYRNEASALKKEFFILNRKK